MKMKIEHKKKVLLKIFENLFEDDSEEINYFNCVGFYNFLLDSLEFEARFLPFYEKEYYSFLKNIIDIFCHFDQYIELDPKMEAVFTDKQSLKGYICSHSANDYLNNYEHHLAQVKVIYTWVKDDYLL